MTIIRRLLALALPLLLAACSGPVPYGKKVTISDDVLRDKIRGGWFGQTIGCTYGGPTEFVYQGKMIPDDKEIPWYEDYILETFTRQPGLYDDVYMDLTFLETMVKNGIDCPVECYAEAFSNADFMLWHANQTARYNILNGIKAPDSGYWKNNPHSDDIDFQIEADFIGMLCPGQVDRAIALADRIGHIMNYGDGWYGGVFISALYSLAYVCDDIPVLVEEALRSIPERTGFHDCLSDVMKFYRQYPDDWKKCWEAVMERHNEDIGCPDGVMSPFNIDARINAAYVAIGLLYGDGDFTKTMDIATRCGQDSDCNPASAAGILGVMHGYDAIPDEWKKGAEKIKEKPFPFTSLSLDTACERNFDLILESLGRKDCTFRVRHFTPARYEQGFEGLAPVEKIAVNLEINDGADISFKGDGVVLLGSVRPSGPYDEAYVADVSVKVDGKDAGRFPMPVSYNRRKDYIFAGYGLGSGPHTVTVHWENPVPEFCLVSRTMVVYDRK